MSEFWQRLMHRKLVQWAVAYVAGAFALLQGIDIVAQQFGWPEAVQRGITLAMVLGFFVTLLLAWYHGERGAQKVSGTELLLLALLLAIGGGVLWKFVGAGSRATHAGASQAATVPPPAATPVTTSAIPQKSVAVLPFANDGGEQGEQYFSDGLSEDLITALAQFGSLKVISRDSAFQYRDSKLRPSRIGRELGVAHLLEGSVRRAGDTVRISATLVNAADGSVLWSQRYDRPYRDLFALQDAITRAVADALKAKLIDTRGAVVQSDRPPSGSLEAYTAYLKGVDGERQNTEQGLRDTIAAYNEALRLDPRYAAAQAGLARAWAGLADGYSGKARQSAFARARATANTAVALDPDSAQAHLARGHVSQMEVDFAGFETETRHALQLAPENPEAIGQMGSVYSLLGQTAKAQQMFQQALQRDPRNVAWYINLADTQAFLGHPDQAVQTLHDAIALRPGATSLHAVLALYEALRGDTTAALAAARQEAEDTFWRPFSLAMALQTGADRAAADAALDKLIARRADISAYQIAMAYALRREPDRMFDWLQRAWRNRDAGLGFLLSDPFLKPYRDDPRFVAFARKIGLPAPGTLPDPPAATDKDGSNE